MIDTAPPLPPRYRALGLLGRGGMGTVYKATDTTTGTTVAVKVLRVQGTGEDALHRRFLREVGTLRAVEHPAIVRYVDHGITPAGQPYLTMEWLPGPTLDEVLAVRGLSLVEALELTRRLADALLHLHGRGIVHRDVKPSNVVLRDGAVTSATLVDFGVVRFGEDTLTGTGHIIGTPLYMAPEQVRSARSVDGRADVFALGAIVYECLTGVRPFAADDLLGFLQRLAEGDAVPPRSLRPELPASVDALSRQLLARDAGERPTTSETLLGTLDALLEEARGLGLGPIPRRGPPRPPAPSTADSDPRAATVAASLLAPLLPAGLPPTAGVTVGRDTELVALGRDLAVPARAVLLWGAPGVGKTRLALEAARRFCIERGDGYGLYFDLRQPDLLDDALDRMAAQLGPGLPAVSRREDFLPAFGKLLRARGEGVLVLDGVDRAAAIVTSIVTALRAAAPGARYLAVARERLRVADARELEVTPLEYHPAPAGAGRPPLPAAVGLLLARASLDPAGLSDADHEGAQRIAEAVEGNPLALELVARQVTWEGLGPVAARAPSASALLGGEQARSTRILFDVLSTSWAHLTADERRALAEASVLAAPFAPATAFAVLSPPEEGALTDVLESLRDKALLLTRPGDEGGVRFALPRTIREFSARTLPPADDLAVRRRRDEHYARLAETLAEEVERSGRPAAFARLGRETEALEHVLGELGAPAPDAATVAMRVLVALDAIAALRGAPRDHSTRIAAWLAVADARATVTLRARLCLARLRTVGGAFDEARSHAEAVHAIATADGHAELALRATLELAAVLHASRDYEGARACYVRVLEGAHLLSPRQHARAVANLAAVEHDLGHHEAALDRYEDALAILERLGDLRLLGLTYANSSILLQDAGDSARALHRNGLALEAFRRVGDRRLLGATLGNRGAFLFELGQPAAALACHEEACALLEDVGDDRSLALAFCRKGAALSRLGRLHDGRAALAEADRRAAGKDDVLRALVQLFRAVLDLELAGEDARREDDASAARHLSEARARVEGARRPLPGVGRSLEEISDDARTLLRTLGRDQRLGGLTVRPET